MVVRERRIRMRASAAALGGIGQKTLFPGGVVVRGTHGRTGGVEIPLVKKSCLFSGATSLVRLLRWVAREERPAETEKKPGIA